jgi:hypothetical protein
VTDIKCFAAIDRVLFYDDDSCDAPWTVNPTGNTCYYCQELLAVADAKLLSPGLALDGNGGGLIGAKRMKWYQVMDGMEPAMHECPLALGKLTRVKDGALLHALLCSTMSLHRIQSCPVENGSGLS